MKRSKVRSLGLWTVAGICVSDSCRVCGVSGLSVFMPALEQNETIFLFRSGRHGSEHVKPLKTAQVLETHLPAIAYTEKSVVASEILVRL